MLLYLAGNAVLQLTVLAEEDFFPRRWYITKLAVCLQTFEVVRVLPLDMSPKFGGISDLFVSAIPFPLMELLAEENEPRRINADGRDKGR